MTPEDKALQLLDRFKFNNPNELDKAKYNALICVHEIIDFINGSKKDTDYWQEVRMHLLYIGTGELEAKADRFNLNA